MITKFEIFEKIKNSEWEFEEDKNIYHYTSEENAIKILKDGFLKVRPRTHMNKYIKSAESDYGYISFTEAIDYHLDDHGGIPTEVRFVFDKKSMNKKYDLQKFDANEESKNNFYNEYDEDEINQMDDQDRIGEMDYYGEEYEIRVYESSIPISEAIGLEYDDEPSQELIDLCENKNIELTEFSYE